MGRVLFASDLDNTLIFSHRHREEGDVCVELLEGREQSFCTPRSLALLAQVCAGAAFLPLTTRSVAQYRRIRWPQGCAPRYAAAANGGILLEEGVPDPAWQEKSRSLMDPWRGALAEAEQLLAQAPMLRRWGQVDGLFWFAVCDTPEEAQAGAEFFISRTGLEVSASGRKLYLYPPPLDKGSGLKRLRARFRPERVLCAGDSELDLPMLRAADLAILPEALAQREDFSSAKVHTGQPRFPEFVLQTVLAEL